MTHRCSVKGDEADSCLYSGVPSVPSSAFFLGHSPPPPSHIADGHSSRKGDTQCKHLLSQRRQTPLEPSSSSWGWWWWGLGTEGWREKNLCVCLSIWVFNTAGEGRADPSCKQREVGQRQRRRQGFSVHARACRLHGTGTASLGVTWSVRGNSGGVTMEEEGGLADTLSIQYVEVPVPCASSPIPNRKMHNQVRCWDLSTQVP